MTTGLDLVRVLVRQLESSLELARAILASDEAGPPEEEPPPETMGQPD